MLPVYAGRAKAFGVSKSDLAVWEKVSQIDGPDSVLNNPDFYFREGHMVATGSVPEN